MAGRIDDDDDDARPMTVNGDGAIPAGIDDAEYLYFVWRVGCYLARLRGGWCRWVDGE